MSKYDDEFKDLKKGLPSENTTQTSSVKLVVLFTIVGIIIAVFVLGFEELFGDKVEFRGYITLQVILTGALSLLVGVLQASIFKSKIKSRLFIFVFFSTLGGVAGGFVGGLLLSSGSGLKTPIIIGAINGLISGGISSSIQNKLMRNLKYSMRWFLYNSISWAVIFSTAWTIGWSRYNITNVAIAGAFLMIASGVSLFVFLKNTPQIEFS